MTDEPEDNENDEIIQVRLPRKDYLVLRQMIDDQSALEGVKKFFKRYINLAVWLAASTLTSQEMFCSGKSH